MCKVKVEQISRVCIKKNPQRSLIIKIEIFFKSSLVALISLNELEANSAQKLRRINLVSITGRNIQGSIPVRRNTLKMTKSFVFLFVPIHNISMNKTHFVIKMAHGRASKWL